MNYPDDIGQYNWHPDSPFYDGDDAGSEWDDEPWPEHEDHNYLVEYGYYDY